MPTPYSSIYSVFSEKINDYQLANLSLSNPTQAESIMHGYLMNAATKFIQCNTDLTSYDDTLKQFNNTLTSLEILILAYFMIIEWLDPQINNILLLKQILSDVDYKIYSQAQHLHELRALKKDAQEEVNYLINLYTYNNVISILN